MQETNLTRIRRLLAPPVFEQDEDKTRVASLLHTILLTFSFVVALATLALMSLYGFSIDSETIFTLSSGVGLTLTSLGLLFLTRRGRIKLAGGLLVFVLWSIITLWVCAFGGISGDMIVLTYPLIIALAGLLVGQRAAVVATSFSILAVILAFFLEKSGVISVTLTEADAFDLVATVTIFVLMGLLLLYSVRGTREGFERARRNERDLEDSNRQLEATRASLERRGEHLQATVREYVDFMAAVAQGKLSRRLPVESEGPQAVDPLLVLGRQLNDTVASLQHMITQVREAATKLSSATAEILTATTQQAAGASRQAAAITQASSTIEEVGAIAEQTAQRAQGVAELARRTAQVSQRGSQAVNQAVTGTEQVKERVESIASDILALSEQTQAIGEIIATVNEIAAQSNMLALNAAVEAARAGEAGRGFAVVAGEMRRLAEQSRDATEQVREILSEIQRGVNAAVMATEDGIKGADEGMRLAGQAGESIHQLAAGVTESTQAALQIEAAAGQQLTGMEQIAQAIENIDRISTQSVQSAQQAERAAEDLNDLTVQLQALVDQYRL